MRSLSKIIKAARLKVLVTNDNVLESGSLSESNPDSLQKYEGTILEASNLVDSAKDEAAEIIQKAKAEAEVIIRQSEEKKLTVDNEIEALKKQAEQQAHEHGHEQGYKDGIAQAQEEIQAKAKDLICTLNSIINEAAEKRSTAIEKQEEDLLKLSLYIAEKIVRREIQTDPSWLLPVIKSALNSISNVDTVTIRVSPKDYQSLCEAESFVDVFDGIITWENDQSLEDSTCIIETEYGSIDASLETRLAKISSKLMEQIYVE